MTKSAQNQTREIKEQEQLKNYIEFLREVILERGLPDKHAFFRFGELCRAIEVLGRIHDYGSILQNSEKTNRDYFFKGLENLKSNYENLKNELWGIRNGITHRASFQRADEKYGNNFILLNDSKEDKKSHLSNHPELENTYYINLHAFAEEILEALDNVKRKITTLLPNNETVMTVEHVKREERTEIPFNEFKSDSELGTDHITGSGDNIILKP